MIVMLGNGGIMHAMRWIGGIACVLAQSVMAQEQAPIPGQYLRPHDPLGRAQVVIDCDPVAPDAMSCRFTLIEIDYLANPNDLDAEIAKDLAELREKVKSVGLKKHVESMCGSTKEYLDDERRLLEHLRKAGRRKPAQQTALLLDTCADPTEVRLEEYVRQHTIWNSKSCMINMYSRGPVRLAAAAPGKFAGSGGPHGECKERYAYALEQGETHGARHWTWSQTLTSFDTALQACKEMVAGKKVEFSSWGYKPLVLCEEIEFFRWE